MYSSGSNDESYTPDYGVKPILKYIPKDAIVWCPFDTEESEFVKQIGEQNEVIHSHIEDGCDFLTYEPEFHKWDVIVSNPPFTNKRKYFERALSFNKPFAMIMTNTWLNDSAPKQLFKDKHKTELRKGLSRVSVTGAAAPGTPITADNKPVGTLHSVAGGEGIAYLRFDRATGPMQAGDAEIKRIP